MYRHSLPFLFLASVACLALGSCAASPKAGAKAAGDLEVKVDQEWVDPAADYPSRKGSERSEDPRVNPEAPTIAIRGGTVLTATGERFEPGLVILEGGAIRYVGKADKAIPDGAQVIDATGKTVTPGLIDTHSHIGVYATPHVDAHSDGNEMTGPTTPHARAEYGYWPQDPSITRARAGGVTTAQILPGSANLIGGRGFTVVMRPGRTTGEVAFPSAPPTIKMACGENPKRVYGEKGGPQTRMAEYSAFRSAFHQAAEYRASWRKYARERSVWQRKRDRARELEAKEAKNGGSRKVNGEVGPTPPARDLGLETLAGVLSGDVLVQVHCYRADEMRKILAVANELGFKVRSFHHALEAYKIADILAEHDVSVSTWADWWGFKMEAFDGIEENAALVAKAGARAIIHSDSSIGIQRLNQEAAKAMHAARAAGLDVSDEEALRWVTVNPAWALGLSDVTGTLEKGKRADVVIWSTHPFSVYSRADVVVQGGEVVYRREQGLEPTDFELGNASLSDWKVGAIPTPLVAPSADTSSAGKSTGNGPSAEPISGNSFAITNATIVVAPNTVQKGTIVVKGGVVIQVGPGAQAGSLPTIDGTGKVVTAGLIESTTPLGLSEVSGESASVDGQFTNGQPVHAAYRASDGYNARSVAIPVARKGGVTSAIVAPDGGLVSGTSALAVLAEGKLGDEVLVRTPVAMHAQLGQSAAGAADGSRGMAIVKLRELLDDAQQYAQRKAAFERNQSRRFAASRLDLEALVPVVRGQLPLVISAHRASDIRAALRLARDMRLRLVIAGGTEAWMLAEQLARAKVPVLLDPTSNLPTSFERVHVREDAAAILAAAGVDVAISTLGSVMSVRNLRQLAGNAVAGGLSWAQAFAAITEVPARIFAIGDRGTLARGQVADLVLWSGDPLEISSRPERLFISGVEQPLTSRQDALRDRYRKPQAAH